MCKITWPIDFSSGISIDERNIKEINEEGPSTMFSHLLIHNKWKRKLDFIKIEKLQTGEFVSYFFLLEKTFSLYHISIEEKNNSSRIQKNILKDIDRKVELQRYDKKMKTSWVFFC